MDKIDSYFALIKHNVNLLDLLTSKQRPPHLVQEDFSDWCVTTIFYILCIYMKAFFTLMGKDVQDHYTLRQLINTTSELYAIAKYYRHIEEASRDARYEGKKYSKDYLIDRILLKFEKVSECIEKILRKHKVNNIPKIDIKSLLERI
ncbi:MAG: hypothetical protein L6416_11225 [Candidatus Omnitrophica bacterium]|nr:hypothetical protein [Candidatus Omnitrophota bacterium]